MGGDWNVPRLMLKKILCRVSFLLVPVFCLWFVAEPLRAQALSGSNTPSFLPKEKASHWGRDPFSLPNRSNGLAREQGGEFHLSAIIYRKGRGLAIINNKILRKGDMIEGRRVAVILEDRVVLRSAAGELELRVNKIVLGR